MVTIKSLNQTHALMGNPNGLVAEGEVGLAGGHAKRGSELEMVSRLWDSRCITLADDMAYDTQVFIAGAHACNATPHVAQNRAWRGGSAIDRGTTQYPGYLLSQRCRKRIEMVFGWTNTVGSIRKTKLRGWDGVDFQWLLPLSGDNLVRVCALLHPVPI